MSARDEHVVIVALVIDAECRAQAQAIAYHALGGALDRERRIPPGHSRLTAWWHAEPDRLDGSDCDNVGPWEPYVL